ncbi:MAG: DUF4837 family protein [Bacteroidales bacterium]|nr:DUF4837 family protein [Bacteroidales bacterium]
MSKKILALTLIAVIAAGMISCNSEKSHRALMPPITGRPGEVTLVMSTELYDGFVGDSLYAILCQEEPALPQSGMDGAEPMFDLIQIPPTGFGNIFKSNRNIIIAKIDPNLKQSAISVERDYWAKNQLLIRLGAPSKEAFVNLIDNKDDFLINTIRDAEIDRQIYLNRKYENTELVNQLKRKHKMVIQFPKGWQPRVDTGNFMWVQYNPPDITQGVLVYYYPYHSEEQLEYENMILATDEWLKARVPGSKKGSYMSLELRAPVYSKVFSKDGHYVRELKGLWDMQNGTMGGPFICWSFVDEGNSRIVSVFGFVFAPKYNKRNHIRKVESLLKTVSFPEE